MIALELAARPRIEDRRLAAWAAGIERRALLHGLSQMQPRLALSHASPLELQQTLESYTNVHAAWMQACTLIPFASAGRPGHHVAPGPSTHTSSSAQLAHASPFVPHETFWTPG
jgi:hypothetical protein